MTLTTQFYIWMQLLCLVTLGSVRETMSHLCLSVIECTLGGEYRTIQEQHNTDLEINGSNAQFSPVREFNTLIVWQILSYLRKSLRLVLNR